MRTPLPHGRGSEARCEDRSLRVAARTRDAKTAPSRSRLGRKMRRPLPHGRGSDARCEDRSLTVAARTQDAKTAPSGSRLGRKMRRPLPHGRGSDARCEDRSLTVAARTQDAKTAPSGSRLGREMRRPLPYGRGSETARAANWLAGICRRFPSLRGRDRRRPPAQFAAQTRVRPINNSAAVGATSGRDLRYR